MSESTSCCSPEIPPARSSEAAGRAALVPTGSVRSEPASGATLEADPEAHWRPTGSKLAG